VNFDKEAWKIIFCFYTLEDWLLVASGVFQGIFAIFVAYFGNRFHRTAWLGALLMLQAFICVLVVIPTLVHQ
jgi:hypothetical protein